MSDSTPMTAPNTAPITDSDHSTPARSIAWDAIGMLGAIFATTAVHAQSADPAPVDRLAPVVVTATRTEAAPFDIPASIDRIGGEVVRDGRAQVNISESLGGVPGLLARDRQNYSQDVQI